ncbi:ATP-binding cassette domain-containing protein, partial [bacterium]|nr:ATP-binding cassette domain-containing protein [bacterium]
VGKEVIFALLQRGVEKSDAERLGKEWLSEWDLPAEIFWDRKPQSLSGGEKRRLALASCTIFSPDLALLDEPLAGLDKKGEDFLIRNLTTLAKKKVVIVATHKPEKFLSETGTILCLSNKHNQIWFYQVQSFLSSALADPSIFPLPEWYCSAVFQHKSHSNLPIPLPYAVAKFLKAGQF